MKENEREHYYHKCTSSCELFHIEGIDRIVVHFWLLESQLVMFLRGDSFVGSTSSLVMR